MAHPTDMTHPVTRAELEEVIAELRTELRTELRSDMSGFATRDELAALRTDMNNSFASVAQQFVVVNQQLTALATDARDVRQEMREIRHDIRNLPEEIARFNRGDREQTIRELRLLDDKYADLPARVKKLEERPSPRASVRRRKRAS
ncbi:hypothetical protein BH11MYX1_BH11MYX1_05620 [soil metagenome]